MSEKWTLNFRAIRDIVAMLVIVILFFAIAGCIYVKWIDAGEKRARDRQTLQQSP